MSLTHGNTSRINYSSIYEHNYPRHAIYFHNRPSTTHKPRPITSQKNRTLHTFSYNKKTEHSEIDFKKDRFPYEHKYNPILNQKSYSQNQKTSPSHQKQQIITKPLPKMDNLKTSLIKYEKLMQTNNDVMKNIVRQQILSQLWLNDPIFKKIDKNLVESLIMIGKIKLYEQEQLIPKIEHAIGFLLYGKLKIFNQDYKTIVQKGDIIGENIIFHCNISLKALCLEQSCLFWLPYKYYLIIREQSIRNGLKKQFNQLEIALRLSFIKKKYDTYLRKTHL